MEPDHKRSAISRTSSVRIIANYLYKFLLVIVDFLCTVYLKEDFLSKFYLYLFSPCVLQANHISVLEKPSGVRLRAHTL